MSAPVSQTGSDTGEKVDVQALECARSREAKEEVEEAGPPILTPEQEKKLWRKVDMRILPILTIMYLCSFMDRGEHYLQRRMKRADWNSIGNIGASFASAFFRSPQF